MVFTDKVKQMALILILAVMAVVLGTSHIVAGANAWFSTAATATVNLTARWDLPDYPPWDPAKIYDTGDYVTYQGRVYWAQWWTQGQIPGTVSVWQEVTDEWRWFNVYKSGDIVFHNGGKFVSRNDGNQNKEPGLLSSPWNEVTDQWRSFNVYTGGEIVLYNGHQYRAKWYNQNQTPGSADVWELIQ